MDALEALCTRVSPLQLVEPGPTKEELDKILGAAVCAPDHGRLKPWRFVLISGDARIRFGELMVESLRRREPTALSSKLDIERKKALRAPVIIIAAAEVIENRGVPGIEQVVAVGAATQNMLIAAHAMGYGAFWRTGPVAYDDEVKSELGFADATTIVAIIYMGSIARAGKPHEMDSLSVTRIW